MDKIPVLWHLADSFWDSSFPRWILDRAIQPDHKIRSLVPSADWELPSGDVGIILIPGRHSCEHYTVLNEQASHFKKVIWILYGDEEGIFHADRLEHPNQRKWWFMPPLNPKQKVDVVAINGWTTGTPLLVEEAAEKYPKRKWDWSFYGQMTHIRRVQMADAFQDIPNGELLLTPGFAQGVDRNKYFEVLVQSKIVPCASGPCTPDTFRFAEALEAGCVPILDGRTQNSEYPPGYWDYVFPWHPFKVMDNWADVHESVEYILRNFHDAQRACYAWWLSYKWDLVHRMAKEIHG